jgi:hypothetical protein
MWFLWVQFGRVLCQRGGPGACGQRNAQLAACERSTAGDHLAPQVQLRVVQ